MRTISELLQKYKPGTSRLISTCGALADKLHDAQRIDRGKLCQLLDYMSEDRFQEDARRGAPVPWSDIDEITR